MSARRSNGESTVVQDAAGRWHGFISFGVKANGKRDRRHVTGMRKSDVVKKVKALERVRDAGLIAGSDKVTVAGWLTIWLDTIAARRVRPSTLDTYRGYIGHRIIPALGHHRLDRLTSEHVDAFYQGLEADGLSSTTALQIHHILSRALKVAVMRHRAARNVCDYVDPPAKANTRGKPLSLGEARAVMAAAAGQRNAARWTVALTLGLRQAEALGLTWSAIDFAAGTLRVTQTMRTKRGGGWELVAPKSNAGTRTIHLPATLLDPLRAHRAEQNAERLAAGDQWESNDFVFAQPNGRPIGPRVDWGNWKGLLAAAGVRDVRLHDARHTAATLMLLAGVQPRTIMDIVGHSSIALTMNTYTAVASELSQEAADAIDRLWETPQIGPSA